jgi:hypothetical protein
VGGDSGTVVVVDNCIVGGCACGGDWDREEAVDRPRAGLAREVIKGKDREKGVKVGVPHVIRVDGRNGSTVKECLMFEWYLIPRCSRPYMGGDRVYLNALFRVTGFEVTGDAKIYVLQARNLEAEGISIVGCELGWYVK